MKKEAGYMHAATMVASHIVMGLGIGSVVATVCIVLMNGMDDTMRQVIGWLIASACYGMISLIYDTEWLPLPGLITVHMLGCMGVTLLTAWLLGYAETFGQLFWLIVPMFVGIYVVISAAITLFTIGETKKINAKISR